MIINPADKANAVLDDATQKHVFIHIPKTAGSFVRSVLERHYGKLGCAYPTPPFDRLSDMTEKTLARFLSNKVLIGHEDYYSFHKLVGCSACYTTILRNPVDRVISLYNHAQTHFDTFRDHKVSILKFLTRNVSIEVDNLQVRYLCGKPKEQPVTTDDVAHAIDLIQAGNLQVGIQERLPKSFAKLCLFQNIRLEHHPNRVNTSSFGFDRTSFSQGEIDTIRQMNTLDFQLYSFCLERLKTL